MKKLLIFSVIILVGLMAAPAKSQDITQKIKHPVTAMDNSSVELIVNAMRQKSTDENKLVVAQDGLKNNAEGITTDQMLMMMNQFQTDAAKLDCAKFAYTWCTDYKNYLKLQDNFGSEASKQALKDFLKKRKDK